MTPGAASDCASLAATAAGDATAAAVRSRVAIAETQDIPVIEAACALLTRIWGNPPEHPVIDAHMVRAFALSGEQVLCAYEADHAGDPDHVVGASVAWFGRDAEGEHLHSHITGVDPGLQGRSIGYALKLHQRAWALERGIATVRWTFDPLLRRNAFFNLCKLGAFADRYHVDLYGAMTDATNAGDESDRFAVCWSLTDARATRAAAGSEIEPDIESLAASGASVILDEGSGGRPIASPPSGGVLLARVPAEMTRMRIEEPALAREWRAAARDALGGAFAGGFVATGITRSGWYVLERDERVSG